MSSRNLSANFSSCSSFMFLKASSRSIAFAFLVTANGSTMVLDLTEAAAVCLGRGWYVLSDGVDLYGGGIGTVLSCSESDWNIGV